MSSLFKWLSFFSILLIASLSSCNKDEIPIVRITCEKLPTDERQWAELSIQKDFIHYLQAEIKVRGGYSRKFDKKSFRIELDKAYNFFDLGKDDDWILNANYIDKTFCRHVFSYNLWRKMSILNKAPKSAFAEVYINDQYEGLYVLMQKVNANFLNIDKKDVEAFVFKDPPLFREEPIQQYLDFKDYQKFPKTKSLDSFLIKLNSFLIHSPDSLFRSSVFKKFDQRSIMDWHLILLLSNNNDGILKNFYLYKESRDSLMKLCLWDYDHSFGRDGDNEKNFMERPLRINRSVLFNRLNQWETYKLSLKDRYTTLRDQQIFNSKSLIKDLESLFKQIDGSPVIRNGKRWPYNADNYYDDCTPKEELSLFKSFILLRIDQLDTFFEY